MKAHLRAQYKRQREAEILMQRLLRDAVQELKTHATPASTGGPVAKPATQTSLHRAIAPALEAHQKAAPELRARAALARTHRNNGGDGARLDPILKHHLGLNGRA